MKGLAKAEKRLSELDDLFAKLYEDRAKNTVSERNYVMLSGRYQDEQIQPEADVKKLKETLNQMVASKENAERWIFIICKYRLIRMNNYDLFIKPSLAFNFLRPHVKIHAFVIKLKN